MEPGKLGLKWYACCLYCSIPKYVIDGREPPGSAILELERLGWTYQNNAWVCRSCSRNSLESRGV